MGLFGQMGDMYKLQKEAKRIKKELASIHVHAEADGVKVTVSAEQEILSVEILDETVLGDARRISNAFTDATNRAFKKAQAVAAEKMNGLMGGFPGLGGGA